MEAAPAACSRPAFFADAEDDATAARIVEQLGGDRVHVLVTLRLLAKIMPSRWARAAGTERVTVVGSTTASGVRESAPAGPRHRPSVPHPRRDRNAAES
ncbi:hypothetical protein [Streptomyces sp. NPDC005799]|uniref:hypothetical protein n=1 Tax=Streptomyces sp. NPDC005799 TaxID=3154678 RepID=UPI0033EF06CD